MGFITFQFLIFFVIVFAVYWLTPARYRYIVLLAGSCIFYVYAGSLALLLVVALWTYLGGILIERTNRRPIIYWLFWGGNLAILAAFKIGDLLPGSIVLQTGMSFYIFQTCWYLSDVYRKGLRAEQNPIRYGAFAMFFPTVLSGPIQRGRELLPMIRVGGVRAGAMTRIGSDGQQEPVDTAALAMHGLELFLWGMAVKLFVSNRLAAPVAYIFDRPGFYSKAYYLPAAMLFAVQLYADFASYSDMAIGVAAMLGYPLRKNFNNPFLSTSLTELWNRWHVSLNEWLIENIYIPLGGSRKGTVRKYVNQMIVFLVSGAWHGQGLHFIVWGLYNGILMIIGEVRPHRIKAPVWVKRCIVFLLFSLTFIFFRAENMEKGIWITRGIFTVRPSDLSGFYLPELFENSMLTMLITFACIAIFAVIQYMRRTEAAEIHLHQWNQLPVFVRVLILGLLLSVCVIAACGSSATTNTQFVYYNF